MSESPTLYVRDARPGDAAHAQGEYGDSVLANWPRISSAGILLHEEQNDPAWPKLRRILLRHGWQPAAPLTYQQVQALNAWCRSDRPLLLDWRLMPPPPQPKAGGAAAHKAADGQAAPSAPTERQRRNRRTPNQRQSTARTRLWHPWPQPSRALVGRAERLLHLVQQELSDEAREALAVGWRKQRLAVRQEMGQLDAARNWQRLTVPRILLALDFSGSMGGFVTEVAALGAALAATFPWLVVAAAPNACIAPLTTVHDKQLIVDGQWAMLPEGLPPEAENNAGQWRMIDATWPVAAAIYVGDYEDCRMADAFAGRFGVLSVYQARNGAPIRTDHAYGEPTPYPTVTRCNSAEDFLAGMALLLPALLR